MSGNIFASILVCLLIGGILFLPVRFIYRQYSTNRKLRVAVYVFILTWIARFFVGFFGIPEVDGSLTVWEEVCNSLIHTFQTFSMDENYIEYIFAGKELLDDTGLEFWSPIYGVLVSILNICAPVLGGAVLLDILTSIFPSMRLYFMPWRQKFVFSELNEASICLAEDIFRGKHDKKMQKPEYQEYYKHKSAIIFTDAYLDDESESNSELFERAKAIGAVCVQSDLLHIDFSCSKSVSYFLIDTDATKNMSTFSQLLKGNENGNILWPRMKQPENPLTRVFVFAQDDMTSNFINKICEDNHENAEHILVRTIRDYRNMAINLMEDAPLFLPLLSKPEDKRGDLFVTIFGDGQIAEEVFKAVFWCGQIYGVQLHINVFSQNADSLRQRLQIKCPELLRSCQEDDRLLEVFPKAGDSRKNPPYSVEPQFCNVEDVMNISEVPEQYLKHSDYYIVALGSDEKNLEVAGWLRTQLMQQALEGKMTGQSVVAAAVFNIELGAAAEVRCPDADSPYLITFGDLRSRFSCVNVFMTNFTSSAKGSAKLYDAEQAKKERDDEYKHWSNIAKTVHAPYKLFAAGAIKACKIKEHDQKPEYAYVDKFLLTKQWKDRLAWMEHRRWNAFLRTEGFVCPSREQLDNIYDRWSQTKSIQLKLHPCLVECWPEPTPLPDEKIFADETLFDGTDYDYLDFVSMYIYRMEMDKAHQEKTPEGLRGVEYKHWDYKEYDAELLALLALLEPSVD